MIPLSSAMSGGLVWSKIPHQRGYQLTFNGEVVGTMRRTSFWSSEIEADSHDARWSFRRTGCFGTEIVETNFNTRIASMKANWGAGGTLVFFDGQTFRIAGKGFWRPVWSVLSGSGQPVLSIDMRHKKIELANTSDVRVSPQRLTLLAIFAWHVVQRAQEDAAATAVLVAAG